MNPIQFTCKPGSSPQVRALVKTLNEFVQVSAQIEAVTPKLKEATGSTVQSAEALITSASKKSLSQIAKNTLRYGAWRGAMKSQSRHAKKLIARSQALREQIADALVPVLNGPDAGECLWIAQSMVRLFPPETVARLKQSCPSTQWS